MTTVVQRCKTGRERGGCPIAPSLPLLLVALTYFLPPISSPLPPSYLRLFLEQSDGRAHATYLTTGYVPLGERKGHDVSQSNGMTSSASAAFPGTGDSDATINGDQSNGGEPADRMDTDGQGREENDDGDEVIAIPAPTPTYTTELQTKQEPAQEEIQVVMLVPQESLEGEYAWWKEWGERTGLLCDLLHLQLTSASDQQHYYSAHFDPPAKVALFSRVLSSEVYSVEPSRVPVS